MKSFGTRQSGIPEFQVADLVEDYPILEEARKVASQIVATPDWREHPDWHLLAIFRKERTFRLDAEKGVEWKFFDSTLLPFKDGILRALYLDEMRQDEGGSILST